MRAHAHHDKPLGALNPSVIALWVGEFRQSDIASSADLVSGAMANKHRLPSPFYRDDCSDGN